MAEEKEEKPIEFLKAKGGAIIIALNDVTSQSGNHTIVKNTIGKVAIGGELVHRDPTWSIRIEGIGNASDNSYFISKPEDFRLASVKETNYYKANLKEKEKLVELPIFTLGDIVSNPEIAYTTNYSKRLEPNTEVLIEDVIITSDPFQNIFSVEGHPDYYKMIDFVICQKVVPVQLEESKSSKQEDTL